MAQLRSVTCYPTQVNTPRLNPSHAGRYSIYLPRRDGRLSWPSWLDSAPAGSRTSDLSITSPTLNQCNHQDKVFSVHNWLARNAFSSVVIWRMLRCVSLASFWEQLRSSTRLMFGAVRADFGRPLPAWRSTADPVASTRRQIFCTVINFHCLCEYARIIAFSPNPCSSRSLCVRILSTCDTFPIVTALTKCT